MKSRFRLTKLADFQRVRRDGKSYAHPLIVLIAAPNYQEITRWGVVAGRSVGNAVQRNRAKRRIRAAIQAGINRTVLGWDIILIARPPVLDASFAEICKTIEGLLFKAQLTHETLNG